MTKIGISFKNKNTNSEHNNLFENGINQNILFFYKLFEKQGYDVHLLSNIEIANSNYKYIDIYNQNELNTLDYFINIGLELTKDMLLTMKKENVTLIAMHLGNACASHIDKILHYEKSNYTLKNGTYYDEVWISPHFEYSIDYYKYIHQTENVKIIPYIWEPTFLDNYTGSFDKNNIRIGVFESNINLNKSSFIPMIICENAKEYITKSYIFSSKKLINNKLFVDFAKKSDLVNEGKMTFEDRHIFVPMMNNNCNVVVSFNENWGLNYLLLECLYLGIPLIHNSPFFKDYGYYYEKYDTIGAAKHIEHLYKHGFNKEKYLEKNKSILYKYSPENPDNIKFFLKEFSKNNTVKTKENHFIISLTTLPSRLSYLEDCLESLLKQDYGNYEIHINIPIHNKIEGSFHKKLQSINNKVKFFYVDDIGSITRLYYTLYRITDMNQHIIIVDDNCKYNKNMLKTYNIKINENGNSAIGFSGLLLNGEKISNVDNTINVNILENQNSVCYLRRFFTNDFFIKILNDKIDWCPKEVIHEDDIVISRYLHSKNIPLHVVSSKIKEDDPLILMYPITKINNHNSGLHHFRNKYGSKIDSIKKINIRKIPKHIFQTWKTKELPNEDAKYFVKELQEHNPEFVYHFYTDEDIVLFIDTNYPHYKETFDNFKYTIQKIDFFRLLVIYHYGGFYFDVDVHITKNLSDLCDYSCVFPEEFQKNGDPYLQKKNIHNLLGNYAFGASPKHPFIQYCIDNIVTQKIKNENIPNGKQKYIFFTTGPVFITDCYGDYYNKKDITVLVEDSRKRFCFGNYGSHKMLGSWKEDNNILNNIKTFNTKYGKISLYKNEKFIIKPFINNSYWDIDTLIKIKDYINPHRNILEIGAHSGTSTIIYASYLDKNSKVICYEPQKNQFKLLQKNIEQNNLSSKTTLYNNAVFCDNRELYLNDIDLDGGGGNIKKRYNDVNKLECNFGGVSLGKNGELITSITLDSKNHSNIGFIHCDAQGAENYIFSKSKNLIKYNRPVILYENNKKYAKYLYDKVCNSYPEYNIESKFDIEKYCMEELKYSKVIYNFNNSQDDLLIP